MQISTEDAKRAGHAIGTLLAVADEMRSLWPLPELKEREELERLGKRLVAEALAEQERPESEWDEPPRLRAVPPRRDNQED